MARSSVGADRKQLSEAHGFAPVPQCRCIAIVCSSKIQPSFHVWTCSRWYVIAIGTLMNDRALSTGDVVQRGPIRNGHCNEGKDWVAIICLYLVNLHKCLWSTGAQYCYLLLQCWQYRWCKCPHIPWVQFLKNTLDPLTTPARGRCARQQHWIVAWSQAYYNTYVATVMVRRTICYRLNSMGNDRSWQSLL